MMSYVTGGVLMRLAAVAVGVACVAASNSKKPAQSADQPAGQVIAKVGNEDLTIHELRNEFRHAGISPDKVNEAVTRTILADLVRRKSLAQRARAAGLDREPTVLLDTLRGRDQVLATALLQRDIQSKVSSIGKAEVDRFINANPDRFSRRVRFDIEQFSIAVANLSQDFLNSVKDASTLDALEAKASEAKLPYTRGAGALFTGDIPEDLVTRIRNRKDTDIFFVRTGAAGQFFKVRAETPDPLAGDAAQQRAQALLRAETAQDEIRRKGNDADVTYMGEYAKLMENAGKAQGAQAPAGQPSPPQTK
jgi:EpsD family peptidyl-prolyl cis-trans isomerase